MFKSNEDSLSVICNIGTATVSAGLVLFEKGKKPTVLYTTKLPISVTSKPDFKHLENLVVSLFEKLIISINNDAFKTPELLKLKSKKIEKVYIVLSTQWHSLKSSKVSISKKYSFILDEELIGEAVKNEELLFESEAISGKYKQIQGKDIRMIEREIIAVKLNGYMTQNPYEKRASSAEFSVYMSLSPEDLISNLEKIINKYLHVKNIIFRTFPIVYYGAIRQMYPHEEDLLLVDISGESTDISLVHNGIINNSVSFNMGINSLIRKLMNSFNVSEDIALSYLHLSKNNIADKDTSDAINSSIEQNSVEWGRLFEETVKSITEKNRNLSHTCFIVADSGRFESFVDKIDKQALNIQNIVLVTEDKEKNFINLGKHIKEEAFITLESIFLATQQF